MALLQHPASSGKFVDDRFSALVEPNLFDNNVFQPGITFTDKYTLGSAGQIFIHKLGKVTVAVGAPGEDFTDTNTADSIVSITLNKAFRRSEKIYGATAAAVAYPIAAAHLEQALQDIRDAWNKEAAKVFLEQKYDLAAGTLRGGVPAVLSDTPLTKTNIYESVVRDRAALVALGARPNVLLVTPNVYSLLLQSEEFVRASDMAHGIATSGQLGTVAGLACFESQSLPVGTAIATVNYDVEYYMYDADAFSIVTNVEVLRLVDSERFNGSLAQAEIVTGYSLTNPERAIIKIKASA